VTLTQEIPFEEKPFKKDMILVDKECPNEKTQFFMLEDDKQWVSIERKQIKKLKRLRDPAIDKIVEKYKASYAEQTRLGLGFFECGFTTVTAAIRQGESVIGNFLADLAKTETNADCAILNAGNIRGRKVFQMGKIALGDLFEVLSMPNCNIVKLKATKEQIKEALENGISDLPGTFCFSTPFHFFSKNSLNSEFRQVPNGLWVYLFSNFFEYYNILVNQH
jgi:2',3'-cyclic-nucleotide 2'-phosphodiesterase (5'-nucleotidase family)